MLPKFKRRIACASFVILPVVALVFHQASHAFFTEPSQLSRSGNALFSAGETAAVKKHNETVYHQAWKIVADKYCVREKLVHWDKWRNAYDGRLDNADKLNAALRRMVASLHDRYTFLLSADDQRRRTEQAQKHNALSWYKLANNIGYLRLENFCDSDVCSEFDSGLRQLADTNGLVIDLRGNHGGFVSYAQDIFAMLSDSGTFVSYQGFENGSHDDETYVLDSDGWRIIKNGAIRTERRSANLIGDKPIVVLVDNDTRSAAEMLAGALRDTRGARLIGQQTFGKGVMQDTYNIGDGLQLKVVTAKYFLPNGTCIHHEGIKPDIAVKTTDAGPDTQLRRACSLLSSTIAQSRGRNFHVL